MYHPGQTHKFAEELAQRFKAILDSNVARKRDCSDHYLPARRHRRQLVRWRKWRQSSSDEIISNRQSAKSRGNLLRVLRQVLP